MAYNRSVKAIKRTTHEKNAAIEAQKNHSKRVASCGTMAHRTNNVDIIETML